MAEENRFEAPESQLLPRPKLPKTLLIIASAKQMMDYHRNGSMTYGFFLRYYWRRHLFALLLMAGSGYLALGEEVAIRPLGIFLFALFLGTTFRDQVWYRAIAKSWWMSDLFTDWNRVQEIADMDPSDPI